MSHSTCCVVNCKNTGKNSKIKFYSFPKAMHKLEQRKRWIAAIRRINPHGSPWYPKPSSLICSAHFVNNEKSEEELSPSYVPSIFPNVYKVKAENEIAVTQRYNRYMRRRKLKLKPITTTIEEIIPMQMDIDLNNTEVENAEVDQSNIVTKMDKECQVDIYFTCTQPEKTFTCNSYIFENGYCDAQVQTDIVESINKVIVPNQKQFKDKKCGTPQKELVDQSVGPDPDDECVNSREVKVQHFCGFPSVKNNEHVKISMENRLLIFLIKMKTGLTFSALSVLFCMHRTTISRIFYWCLQVLVDATPDLIYWPSKDVVHGTMPLCFYPNYFNTRLIIDCTEFRIEVPASVDNRVYTYSHYKKTFTANVLIGIIQEFSLV